MRSTLGHVIWVAGFLVAVTWTPAASAQYVRMNVGFYSNGPFTSMTVQPVIVPSTARPTEHVTYGSAADNRNAQGGPGWTKSGFSWGKGYRPPESDRSLYRSGATSSLRTVDRRDDDYWSGRYRSR